MDEIIGDHQYGFRRNRLTTDLIFYIIQILEKKVIGEFSFPGLMLKTFCFTYTYESGIRSLANS
jgi:hypothetical protein